MKQRGILLISTLLIMVVIAMVVVASLSMAPSSLVSASSYTDGQRALLAADIGVNYARTRFKEDMAWMGSPDSGPHTVVRTDDGSMVVMEDHGNVVGLVKFDSGQVGQFRIRFNHQDGAGSEDGLVNPSADFNLETPLISKNNLLASSPSDLFEAADTEEPKPRVDDVVQPFQAYIAVEGRAGPGLRELEPSNPNQGEIGLRVVSKLVETRIQANFGDAVDAAAMAAGDINANLRRSNTMTAWRQTNGLFPRRLEIEAASNNDETPPRIRSKGSINVTSDTVSAPNLFSRQGFTQTQDGNLGPGTRANSNLTTQVEADSAGFYSMEWDRIGHANPDPAATDTVNLRAGTYVAWETETALPFDSRPELHYYDMPKDEYIAHIKANPTDAGVVLDKDFKQVRNNYSSTHPNGIKLVTTQHTYDDKGKLSPRGSLLAQVVIRDDVYIEPTAKTSDFTLLPRRGFIEGPPPTVGAPHPGEVNLSHELIAHNLQFQFEPRRDGNAVLTSSGEININAAVHGYGASMTAESDIKIVGSGKLAGERVAKGGDGLSLYSKGDVTVSTYALRKNAGAAIYRDIRLKGVMYAWGDINLQTAQPADSPLPESYFVQNGYLWVDGALVAYGGNPGDASDPNPGSGSGGIGPNKGNINIDSHWASLTYDSRYLAGFDRLATPSGMDVISWTLRD